MLSALDREGALTLYSPPMRASYVDIAIGWCTRSPASWLAPAVAVCLFAGCTTWRDELERGQTYYAENQFENAMAMWRAVEPHEVDLAAPERVRYAFHRGMTDYRLGFKDHARHWLAVARSMEAANAGSLDRPAKELLTRTLADLEAEFHGTKDPLASSRSTAVETRRSAPGDSTAAPKPDAPKPEGTPKKGGACANDDDCGSAGLTCVSGRCEAI